MTTYLSNDYDEIQMCLFTISASENKQSNTKYLQHFILCVWTDSLHSFSNTASNGSISYHLVFPRSKKTKETGDLQYLSLSPHAPIAQL